MQVEVAVAKKQQAEAEISLEQLKEKLRFRTLTEQQRSQLLKILSLGVKPTIEMGAIGGVPEAMDYANQLASLLKDAGWEVEGGGVGQVFYTANNPTGLI